MIEPCDLSATELRRLIGARALSPVELLDSCLARIARVNPAVNAVVTLDGDRAREAAREAEAAVMRGDALGPLHGLPIAHQGHRGHGRAAHHLWQPAVRGPRAGARPRRGRAGAGGRRDRARQDQHAGVGGGRQHPQYRARRHRQPVRPDALGGGLLRRLCCGAGLRHGAARLGLRYRRLLRNPAAYSGIVGLRPSPGLVPNEKRAFGWFSLSVNGPMAREVGDAALLLSVMAGDDARDPLAYTLPGEPVRGRPERYAPPPEVRLETLRVAFTEDFGFAPTEAQIRRVFRTRVAALAPLFGRVAEATPDCDGADDSFAVLRASLFLSNHINTYRERPEMLGPNIRANVEEGLRYDLEDYGRAAAAQTRIYRNFVEFFTGFDVLISPTITLSPRPWRELYPAEIDGVRPGPISTGWRWPTP